jgi:hypothetical protein
MQQNQRKMQGRGLSLADNYDPMMEAYSDPKFNSYVHGPGSNIKISMHTESRRLVCRPYNLFVRLWDLWLEPIPGSNRVVQHYKFFNWTFLVIKNWNSAPFCVPLTRAIITFRVSEITLFKDDYLPKTIHL